MVEISKSGSGEGLGGVIPRGYSKKTFCGWCGLARPSRLRRSHTAGMKSKVHPTYKTQYRVANWPAYNRALVRRGDVTVWLSAEAIAAWTASRSGRRGGQRRSSDLAIETETALSHPAARSPISRSDFASTADPPLPADPERCRGSSAPRAALWSWVCASRTAGRLAIRDPAHLVRRASHPHDSPRLGVRAPSLALPRPWRRCFLRCYDNAINCCYPALISF